MSTEFDFMSLPHNAQVGILEVGQRDWLSLKETHRMLMEKLERHAIKGERKEWIEFLNTQPLQSTIKARFVHAYYWTFYHHLYQDDIDLKNLL